MPTSIPLPSTTLYNTTAGSNKEYHVQVVASPCGSGFLVNTRHGPRGRATVLGTKTPVPVALEKALKLAARVVADKVSGGYTPDVSGVAFVDTPLAGRSSGWVAALLEPVEAFPESLEQLLLDDGWLACEKIDGERRAVEVTAEGVVGINRRGLFVSVPQPWTTALSQLPAGTVLDGEHVSDTFHIFDALQIGTTDLRGYGYSARVAALHSAFLAVDADAASRVSLVPVVAGERAKRDLLASVERAQGEGIVLRHRDSPYTPGRSLNARKHKLLESVSCVVSAHNEGRRSVRVSLVDAGVLRDVGSVTIPVNHSLPAIGEVVEVRYMYLFEAGCLFQPVYLGPRNDLVQADCTIEQVTRVKLKTAADSAAETSVGPQQMATPAQDCASPRPQGQAPSVPQVLAEDLFG
jgi:bifunctional non-homologous end joining protein LigD